MQKIRVGILGATGSVGQRFVQMLADHPWFEVTALAASERSAGKIYREAVNWLMPTPIPTSLGKMMVQNCEPNLNCDWVFSGLDSSVAGEIEIQFAKAGYIVHSNASNHRMNPDVPLIVPEVNSDHLKLIETQSYGKGKIITNPNCCVVGLVIALKPLADLFGLEAVHVVTMQSVSGAGYPGVASLDIIDNVIPWIRNEEEKIETESKKILGKMDDGAIRPYGSMKISAQCNRVPVNDGHMECVSVTLKKKPSPEEMIQAFKNFSGVPQQRKLPLAPKYPIHYSEEEAFPQPKKHRDLEKGMAVSVGRLRKCNLFDYKFVLLSHNTIRGAAGGSILNAELMASN